VSVDFAAAEQFMLREARLLERRRFAHRFRDGSADAVVAALAAYANEDGGFSNALESDLRGASSQPVPVERALEILDDVDRFHEDIVMRACDWLASVSHADGGVPFVLPTVEDGPHAPWWEPEDASYVNPTAGIAGLLHKHGVVHEWLAPATDYCFDALTKLDRVGADDAINVLTFLEHAPDRARAEAVFAALGERILRELVALDPATEGYVKTPLEFAPHPKRLARRLFDDVTIDTHLEALEAKQQDDGGWPITWEPPSVAAVNEWRGYVTIGSLNVLDGYGRLER
jgi:hypothetical protein